MWKSLTIWILAATTASTLACQVPVFRYALERWQADKYRLQVLHKDSFVKLDKLPEQKHANISTEYFDAKNLTDAQQWSIVGLDQVTEYPSHILTAPDSVNLEQPVLIQKTTEKSWKSLTESPARTAIKDKLLAGDSAVFIHLLSGNKATDERTRKLLETTLTKAQEAIELPEGVINPDEVAEAQAKGDIDFDDVLRSKIPLKIAFSIVTLDPADPAEQDFIRILLNGNTIDQLPETSKSLIAPVFGRGRCLALMPASKLTEALIMEKCQYLCNACACSVKDENPGFDLLINSNWDEHLINSSAIIEKAIPELTGAGDFITAKPLTSAETEANTELAHSLPQQERQKIDALIFSAKIFAGLVGIGIIIGSFLIYKKSQLR